MARKQVAVTLRKPPPAAVDRFVGDAAQAVEPSNPTSEIKQAAGEGPVVTTRKGDRRELTIYLPTELAQKLSAHCIDLDRDVSNIVSEILAKALERGASQTVTVPETRWTRLKPLLESLRGRVLGLRTV